MADFLQIKNPSRVEGYDNTTQYHTGWEDLRFPATGIAIGGFASAPDVQTDTGLLLFDGTDIETVGILVQMPHAWKEGSSIHPHLHWAKTSDAAGDVLWTFRYKKFGLGDLQGAWSSIFNATDKIVVDATQKQIISEFSPIDMTGNTVSDLLLIQFGRLPTDAADDYEADALLYEIDIHYEVDSLGSETEYLK